MTDRVRWLPFRILGSAYRRLDLCQMTKPLALRCMVSPHTVTPSGALRYTHARTHAQNVLSNVASFLEDKIPFTVCVLTCRQLFDLPVHLNYRQRRDAAQTGMLVVTTLLPCLCRQYVPGKQLYVSTRQHGVTCRNTVVLTMVLWSVTWLGVSPSCIYTHIYI